MSNAFANHLVVCLKHKAVYTKCYLKINSKHENLNYKCQPLITFIFLFFGLHIFDLLNK